MKEILENVKLSFALLAIRIVDIIMFVVSTIITPTLIGAVYLCGKYRVDSWYFKFMEVVFNDGVTPIDTINEAIKDISNSENVDENEA